MSENGIYDNSWLSGIAVGAAAGPLSMLWLRGREPFETAHAAIALLALLCAGVAAVTGFVLLP